MSYTIALIALLLGVAAGYFLRKSWAARQIGSLEQLTEQKTREAEAKAKEIIVEAKDKAAELLLEAKNEEKERKNQIVALENRLLEREGTLDKRLTDIAS